jgi:hypothetical protein
VTLVGFSEMLDDRLPDETMIALIAKLRRGLPDGAAHQHVREWEQRWRACADRRDREVVVHSANVGMR